LTVKLGIGGGSACDHWLWCGGLGFQLLALANARTADLEEQVRASKDHTVSRVLESRLGRCGLLSELGLRRAVQRPGEESHGLGDGVSEYNSG
jgi:hypothetical protein